MSGKSVDLYMPLWIGDYLADTQHLTRDQHGAYFLLLIAYWRNGGPLKDEDVRLSAITKSSQKEWQKLRGILIEFFTVKDGLWIQKRADAEIAKALELREKKAAGGAKAMQKRWGNDKTVTKTVIRVPITEGITPALQNDSISPSPSLLPPKPPEKPEPKDPEAGARDARVRVVAAALGLSTDPLQWPPMWVGLGAGIDAWVRAGFDLKNQILPACAEFLKAPPNSGKPVAYLGGIVKRMAADAPAKTFSASASGPDPRLPDSDFKAMRRLETWRDEPHLWNRDAWGPTPDEPGCLIAPSQIASFSRKAA